MFSLNSSSESLFVGQLIDHCCTWLAKRILSTFYSKSEYFRIECIQRIFCFGRNQDRLFTNHLSIYNHFIQSWIPTNCVTSALNHAIPFRQQVSLFAPEEGQVTSKFLQKKEKYQQHHHLHHYHHPGEIGAMPHWPKVPQDSGGGSTFYRMQHT